MMDDIYLSIFTVIICLAGYTFAFLQYNRNRLIFALILLMICGFLLRIYAASDLYLHAWDERYHALVAKNLIDHPFKPMLYENPLLPYNYKQWAANHIWVHKQPVPLWTMALSMSIFGINEIALRLPSVLFTTLGIAITFYIAKYLFNKRVAIIAAFLYSIHGLIIELTAGRIATDHIDIFFLFFVQLAVLLSIRFIQTKNSLYNILCGLSIGMAILSKWLPALIVLPLWWLLILDSKKFSLKEQLVNFLLLCLIIIIVSVPWQLYIYAVFPLEAGWESSFNRKHIFEPLEGNGQPFYYHFDQIRMIYGELIYLPLIWFFYKSLKRPQNYRRLMLFTWFVIPAIFFSLVQTKMKAYTLFTAPAIFIITAYFWDYLYRYRNQIRFKYITYIVLILLIFLPVRYSIERIKPFSQRERNPAWAQELKELSKQLDDGANSVIFNSKYPIETMFYTRAVAYNKVPDREKLDELKRKGYRIYIRNYMSDIEGVMMNENAEGIITSNQILYQEWK